MFSSCPPACKSLRVFLPASARDRVSVAVTAAAHCPVSLEAPHAHLPLLVAIINATRARRRNLCAFNRTPIFIAYCCCLVLLCNCQHALRASAAEVLCPRALHPSSSAAVAARSGGKQVWGRDAPQPHTHFGNSLPPLSRQGVLRVCGCRHGGGSCSSGRGGIAGAGASSRWRQGKGGPR